MSGNVNREFETLLSRLTDAGLDDDELQRLGELIETSPDHRRQYLEYCQMHGLLRAENGLLASWGMPESGLSAPQACYPRPKISRRRLAAWGAAAALVGGLAAFLSFSAPRESEPPFRGNVVAQLQREVRAKFVYGPRGETRPTAGSAMPQGRYELTGGIIELKSVSGVVLTLEAPSRFTLLDSKGIRIDDGRVAAHVPKEATGFRVEMPSGMVVDLGTDFAVEAVSGEKSEVHVFNGEVQIHLSGSKAAGAAPLRLTTGKAARIDYVTGMPSGIDLDAERFLRDLDAAPRTYTQRVLQMHPVAYYPMEPAGDGAFLRDVTPGRWDARIHFGKATEPVWAAGKVGLAFALGGPSKQTYASAATYPQPEGDQLSVVAWVSAHSRPRWASIAKNWAGAEDWGQFHFGLYYDSGELEAHIQDSSRKEITVKDRVPLPLNAWHHVAFVADGSTLRLYRNGEEVDAVPYRELRKDARIKALAIGTKLNLNGDAPEERDFNMWDGRLDEVAIFNHALTAAEIRELYELADASE
jgi:ferric-dicitrate binding protein FerR (iron transport regulator)